MPNTEPLPSRGSTDYQVVLVAEMVLLVAGETGLGLLHGWTEGVGYAMQPYYTPMWACAVLMVLLFLLIFSLFLVFVFLHFNRPWIIKHHTLALWISWPVAICLTIGAMAGGAPFLVGFLIFLYFSSLLPFAYMYGSAEWKSTELPEV
uniref:MARVEL domain-containing protein n=1 Tax=Panagrellus redivivus TaxID=6233 RepID=A0A7E4WBI9_PANRE